ncbi:MAG: PDZ domain-containing protein [Chloroflexi bacterium]|nr:PDZ domain-containing protein [Chloroflexota bacterium]
MKKQTLLISLFSVIVLITLSACGTLSLPFEITMKTAEDAAPVAKSSPTQEPVSSEPVVSMPAIENAEGDFVTIFQNTLEQVYARVNPSVVNIQVKQSVGIKDSLPFEIPGFPFFNMPDGEPQQQFRSALGSGFVWDKDGHIVTNNHVIDSAEEIEVIFSDGTILPATMVGADPDSDLAVLKVDADPDLLQPVSIADSDAVKVGQLAIAIGNPYGLEGTMTTGIVSAIGRSLPANQDSGTSYSIPNIIQTDAPINPGNSGGVLLDVQGNVIGVTAAIESSTNSNAGIGFAIPSNIVSKVVPELIQDGSYSHAWLGISGTTLIPDLSAAMDLPSDQRGVLVRDVFPNSPAEEAGLRGSDKQITIDGVEITVGGDVITAIDGQPITKMEDLIAYLATNTNVGQKVTLDILRDGKKQSFDVTMAPRPSLQEEKAQELSEERGVRLGIVGMTLTKAVNDAMNLDANQKGVLVEQVQVGSLADKVGLQGSFTLATIDGQPVRIGGDVITAVNGEAVESVQELRYQLAQLPANAEFTLNILRDGKEMEISVPAR